MRSCGTEGFREKLVLHPPADAGRRGGIGSGGVRGICPGRFRPEHGASPARARRAGGIRPHPGGARSSGRPTAQSMQISSHASPRLIRRSFSGARPEPPRWSGRHPVRGRSRRSLNASPPKPATRSTPASSTHANSTLPPSNPPTCSTGVLDAKTGVVATVRSRHSWDLPPAPLVKPQYPRATDIFSQDARRIVAEDVLIIAERLSQRPITTGHLLIAILESPGDHAGEIISLLLDARGVIAAVIDELPGQEKP